VSDPCRAATCPAGTCVYTAAAGLAAVTCRLTSLHRLIDGAPAASLGGDSRKSRLALLLGKVDARLQQLDVVTERRRAKVLRQAGNKLRTFLRRVQVTYAARIDPTLQGQLAALARAAMDALGDPGLLPAG